LCRPNLVACQQNVLYGVTLGASLLQAMLQFFGCHDAIGDQGIVLGHHATNTFFLLAKAMPDGRGQRFAQLCNTFNLQIAKGLVAFVVDNLQHTIERVPVHNGGHQHLPRAVA